MRQIKFRGYQDELKKWVYGSFVHVNNGYFILVDKEFEDRVRVNPDTVGQFTGLKDKNGVEIYEGDILSYTVFDYNDNDTQYKGVIRFDDEAATYYLFSAYNEEIDYEAFELGWVVSQDCDCEVIGNIYDNKELLEEEK